MEANRTNSAPRERGEYDAVVVGARCAGSATALLLARKGLRVLLVDRVTFPSDTLSTHFIHLSGVAALERWGLLDRVRATGCPPIGEVRLDFGPVVMSGRPRAAGSVEEMFCCRRTVLDKLLVDAAVEAGAELRDGFVVRELLYDDRGAVCGIRGSDGSANITERARLVIGADGRHSMVAKAVQAPQYEAVSPLTCAHYSYWSGVHCEQAQLYSRPGRAIAAMPTNDGLTCVYVAARQTDFHAFRADVEGELDAALQLAGDLGARVSAGHRVERFRGTDDLPNFLRRPYGQGWALVGDAGCHKDPVPAQGISDAFRDAEFLAEAVATGLSDGRITEALSEYERLRNAVEIPRYRFALQLASLQPPQPEFGAFLAGLAADPKGTSQFLGLLAGTTPFDEVFGTVQAQT